MKLLSVSALLALALTPMAASAQVIYHDAFDRGTVLNPVSLYGSSPTVNTTGATWGADGNGGVDFTTNGVSLATSGGGDNMEAFLPFSLANNLPTGASATSGTLTLSLTLSVTGSGDWVALGFSTGTAALYNNGVDWMLLGTDGTVQDFAGQPLPNVDTHSTGLASGLLSISLDLATDMATFSDNGMVLGTYNAGNLSSISYLNITDLHPATGTISNFDLTYVPAAAVPEPSTWALMFGGLAAIGMLMRFRRLNS